MSMRTSVLFILWIWMFIPAAVFAQDKLSIYTVNYPLQYFAERIAGDHAEVIFPAPDGEDPAFWQPSVEIIADYQQADLVLLNGAGYAKWVSQVSLSRRKLVDTSAAFRDQFIHSNKDVTHSHGPDGDHSHSGTAFTTWLDFNQAAAQARAIADRLVRERPEWKADFTRNLAALESDLAELDTRARSIVASGPDKPFIASHPVYQYFQRRYALDLESVMWEPDKVPSEAMWTELNKLLVEHPARWMIWEGQANFGSIKRLQGINVESMVFDPAGNRPDKGDFLSTMRQNLSNLQVAF
jgi:zinc transport system substrate-binding protein